VNLVDQPAHVLAGLLRRGELRAVELTEAFLTRIAEAEPRIRAFLTTTEVRARAEAAAVDAALARGETLPDLAGVPMALKDNIVTRGVPTTAASRILEGWTPPYDATVARRLAEAGAVLVGKTNLDEFAMGSTTENSGFFPTHNPLDPARVPGGSSGGSAAAVGAGEAAYALGSDTGGSIRQPAAFCGVVGLKPTYGRVSRYGLVAFASSLDQIGPITRDVRDAALVLEAIAGADPHDMTSAEEPVPRYRDAVGRSVRGRTFAVPEAMLEGVAEEVADAVDKARRCLADAGMREVTVALPSVEKALAAYYILAPAEASSNLARYDGIRYGLSAGEAADVGERYRKSRGRGFGPEVKRRIMLGTYVLSQGYVDRYYRRALALREELRREMAEAFARADVLLAPTAPRLPFRHGELTDPLALYRTDVLTIPANLAGIPALSLPFGQAQGLPVGVQLMSRWFAEEALFAVGAALEEAAA
jgi:aspartyl-tRNA(Asn)/glutamyl-tRNA(Gln) amidotransferase subunit A